MSAALAGGCGKDDARADPTRPGGDVDPRLECIASHPVPPRYEGVVRSLCAELHDLGGVGAAVAIAEGDRILFSTAVGRRCAGEDAPLRPTDTMRIGSITKVVTAAVAVGSLDDPSALDQDLRTVLPELDEPLTLRSLLMHTSGLHDPSPVPPRDDEAFVAAVARGRAADRSYHYANANYVLVGRWLERTQGRTFTELFESSPVAAPLRSVVAFDLVASTQAACGHGGLFGANPVPLRDEPPPPPWTRAAGGGLASAEQLARLPHALAATGVLDTLIAQSVPTDAPGWSYGLGVRMRSEDDSRVLAHSGNTDRFAADLQWSPTRGVAVAVLSNTGHAYKATLAAAWAAATL